MSLIVNGATRAALNSAPLADLGAAVERNREIAPESLLSETALHDGDQQFVGGG